MENSKVARTYLSNLKFSTAILVGLTGGIIQKTTIETKLIEPTTPYITFYTTIEYIHTILVFIVIQSNLYTPLQYIDNICQ